MDFIKKAWHKAGSGFDKLLDNLAIISFACIIIMMLIISLDVSMRYFLRKPLGWTTDVSVYLMLYICFLSAAYILRRDRHIVMEFEIPGLNAKMKSFLELIISCLIIIMSLMITWYSAVLTIEYYQRGVITHDVIEAPKFIMIGIIPIGMFLVVIQACRRALQGWRQWRET